MNKNRSGAEEDDQDSGSGELRKTNNAIGIRVKEGKLSLLSRKIFNILVYHAQLNGKPGVNAPIKSEQAAELFWLPLSVLATHASYVSNDTELLKESLRELENIKIDREDDIAWSSERLVSSVNLVNPNGLRKRGGTVWFGYSFPPGVKHLIMNPESFTKLSLFQMGLLKTGPGLALYEIASKFAKYGVTDSRPYEYWYNSLTGNPDRETLPEYKYFKRDVIKPAMSEVNTLTDLQLELIEHKRGRKTDLIQFKVEPNKQQVMTLPIAPPINSALIAKIVNDAEIPEADARNIIVEYDQSDIESALALLAERKKNKKKSKIEPANLFRTTLKMLTAEGDDE